MITAWLFLIVVASLALASYWFAYLPLSEENEQLRLQTARQISKLKDDVDSELSTTKRKVVQLEQENSLLKERVSVLSAEVAELSRENSRLRQRIRELERRTASYSRRSGEQYASAGTSSSGDSPPS